MSQVSAESGVRPLFWLRGVLLVLLCAVVYGVSPTSMGLTSWQESVRAVVARDMFERGEWVVPRRSDEPYLNKPPMIYWVQIAIGHARGSAAFTDEFELRVTVALFGMLGVLATWLVGRRLLAEPGGEAAEDAAWWGALGLAVGLLYVRSSRVGELDVLLAPMVVAAVGGLVGAWRAVEAGRSGWGWLGLATVATAAAAMTKGPPALLVIVLAGYGSVVVSGTLASMRDAMGAGRVPTWAVAAGLACAAAVVAARVGAIESVADVMGVVLLAAMTGAIATGVAIASRPAAARAWLPMIVRLHPWLVLGVPLLVIGGWGWLAAARVGDEVVSATAQAQMEGNLRVFSPLSPVRNLGFFVYGVAPLSLACIAGLWLVLRRRWRINQGLLVAIVWLVLGLAAFSMLGKGVARYLLPLWPAVALIGGYTAARWLGSMEPGSARRSRLVAAVVLVGAGLAQAWWYGEARQRHEPDRSPRDLIRMLREDGSIDMSRLGCFEFEAPAIEFYLGRGIEEWGGRRGRALDELGERVRFTGTPYLLLVREQSPAVIGKYGRAEEKLAQARIAVVERRVLGRVYSRPPGRTPIEVWSVRPGDSD